MYTRRAYVMLSGNCETNESYYALETDPIYATYICMCWVTVVSEYGYLEYEPGFLVN